MKRSLIILMLTAFSASAQLHVNVGVIDVSKRMDGLTTVWNSGYSHFFENNVGLTGNIRYTLMANDNYYTAELIAKYRFTDSKYRFEIGPGIGYNFDDGDFHPLLHTQNSFDIGGGLWLTVDFDNSVRWGKIDGSLVNLDPRRETYLTVGLAIDIDYSIFKGIPKPIRIRK